MSFDLFGIDIAAIIGENMTEDDLLSANLYQRTEGSGEEVDGEIDYTAPPGNSFSNAIPCHGFTESVTIKDTREQILSNDRKITIIGDSLPAGVVPTQGDKINIESTDFKILSLLERDPAGAVYTVHARA